MFKRASRIATAFAVSTSLAAGTVKDAQAIEPMTIAATASLISTVLAAGAKPSAVPMAMARAQLDIGISAHKRMTNFEKGLGHALMMISDLPQEMRKAIREEMESEVSHKLRSSIESFLQRLTEVENSWWLNPSKDERLIKHYEDIRTHRNNMFGRSDLMVPSMIRAYAAEIILAKTLGEGDFAIGQIKDLYLKRLKSALDPNKPQSLEWTLSKLKKEQKSAEERISKQVLGEAKPLTSQIVPWYAYSQTQVVEKVVAHECYPRIGGPLAPVNFDGGDAKLWFTNSALPSAAGTKLVLWRDDCHDVTRSVDEFVQNSAHKREITVFPSPFSGIYKLSIQPMAPEIRKDNGIAHQPIDQGKVQEHEARKTAEHGQLEKEVETFNARAAAIEELSLSVLITKATVANIEHNVEISPQHTEVLEGIGSRLEGQSYVEHLERRQASSMLVYQMDKGRADADETIRKAIESIEKAMKEDKAEAWRAQAQAVLGIISASMHLMDAIQMEITLAKLEAAADIYANANKAVNPSKSVSAIPEAGKKSAASVKKPPSAQKAGIDATAKPKEGRPAKPLSEMNGFERLQEVDRILKALGQTPLKNGSKELDTERLRLQTMALKIMDSLQPTSADKFHQKYHQNTDDVMEKILKKQLMTGDIQKVLKTVLVESIRPDVVADGTLFGAESRQLYRNRIIKSMIADQAILMESHGFDMGKDLQRTVSPFARSGLACNLPQQCVPTLPPIRMLNP